VIGRYSTDGAALLEALGIDRGDPILALDPYAARDAIIALPSVRTASVERQLPDTVVIRLAEREPLAIWQEGGRHRVIDGHGVVLAGYDPADHAHLPLVVGPDAPANAADFLSILAARPEIAARTAGATRVGGRRWDLALETGITVRLPADGVARALDRLAELHALDRVFERDVLIVDLRLPDRVTVRTSPVAAERIRLPEENT
jgi:cell division protein FtsQ